MTTFSDFLKNLRLDKNPFAFFTTENELKQSVEIFTPVNDYESILSNFSSDNSLIILGDRGAGKTALLKNLESKIDRKKIISVSITDFSDLPLNFDSKDFYQFLITKISVQLFSSLANEKTRINKLDQEEKILLSYLLQNFVPQISKAYLRDQIKTIQIPWYKLTYKKFEKFIRDIFNYSATAANTLVDDFLSKHFSGLPPITENIKIKEYFPELDINFEENFLDQDISYFLIERILKIIEKLQYSKVIVLIDRIDEDQRFENDAELIANYTKLILTDEKLLLTPKLQIIFTSWTTPFNFIKQYVRTQKHSFTVIDWSNRDLENVINNRLKAFSENKVSNYKELFTADVIDDDINQILKLANSTPRDLWHIFSNLLRIQYDKDSLSNKIEKNSISFSLNRFIKNFNYFEYYPKKTNARSNSMDIFSYIDLLLKLDGNTFNAKQLKEKNQLQHSTAQSYISSMEKMGLISLSNPDSGSAQYIIRDPKISYAREKGIKIYRN
ncbi:hypothetical protein SE27_11190 [Acinetobacter harbinensis]|uniref:P-loop ATPase, Sll1717 family n=1 Tax=Acinetobacter harbinensis TaxID=1353941 RepID=UPI00057E3F21|nr:hypothetical protein [Acinetobacter harbinensis]KWQ05764.1 hypothetical protein SE27_11190 [Acinetobacter harbinensis]